MNHIVLNIFTITKLAKWKQFQQEIEQHKRPNDALMVQNISSIFIFFFLYV